MNITAYPAIIERAAEGFGVFFPDLPGCTSAGATLDEAKLNAAEALSLHLSAMLEDGETLPPASTLEAVERDADVDEAARVMVKAAQIGA